MYNWSYMEKLETELKNLLDKTVSAHGFDHSQRVWNLAKQIHEGEHINVDMEVIYAGSLCHDIGYVTLKSERRTDFANHPQASVEIAEEILPKVGFPEEKIDLTLKVISLHDDQKPWGTHKPVEEMEIWYVQDADNIEALGAIGLTRILEYCFRVDMPQFDPELDWDDPKAKYKSAIHDIYEHVKMYDRLHTKTSKEIAKSRVEYMKDFVKGYVEEYNAVNSVKVKLPLDL